MTHVQSADGTTIAYESTGDGPAVVIINGAMSKARDAGAIAAALADAGFTAIAYDRRARGDSGDTPPVDPEREVEDLAAVIAAAGGRASVLGHSSGAVLALFAASHGVNVDRLFLSEPPFGFGRENAPEDLPEQLQALVDAGKNDEAIVTFQRDGVGLPEEMIEQIRTSPMFQDLLPLAQSTVYDAELTRLVSIPTPEMLAIAPPVAILIGVQTFPVLTAAAKELSERMPQAELIEMPASVMHRLDPAEAATIVSERLKAA